MGGKAVGFGNHFIAWSEMNWRGELEQAYKPAGNEKIERGALALCRSGPG
jgi:hypothetical protein